MIQPLSHQPYYPRRQKPLDPVKAETNRLICDLVAAVIETSEAGTPCGFSYLGNGKIEAWRGGTVRVLVDTREDCHALLKRTIQEIAA